MSSIMMMACAVGVALGPAQRAGGADDALVTGPAAARLGEPALQLVTGIVRKLRMRDCDITVCDDDGVPKDWQALAGGLHLRLSESGRSSDVWALPNDWVAVRTRRSTDPEDPLAEIITVAGVRWATMRDTVCARFFERFKDPVPTYDPSTHRVPARRPAPKPWTPEQVTRQTAVARETFTRFCVLGPERAAGITSLASLGVPAHALYRELCQDHDLMVRDAAIFAQILVADGATTRFLGTLLNRAGADPDQRSTVHAIAFTLRSIADPASIPDLLAALDHVDDPESLALVVDTLAILQCREASPRILDLLRTAQVSAQRVEFAKALSTLRAQEAIPLIRGLIPSTDICGDDLISSPRKPFTPSLMLSYLKLTAPWSPTVDHARILLLPFTPVLPLGKGCWVTLLIEACGEDLNSISFLNGALTVDGMEHQHAMGVVMGGFTVTPGNVGDHVLDLSPYITAAGTHRVGYRCDTIIANDIDVVVAAP